jgi:hypothetical protein
MQFRSSEVFLWSFSCFLYCRKSCSRSDFSTYRTGDESRTHLRGIHIFSDDSHPILKRKKEALYCKNLVCTLIFLNHFFFKERKTKNQLTL